MDMCSWIYYSSAVKHACREGEGGLGFIRAFMFLILAEYIDDNLLVFRNIFYYLKMSVRLNEEPR